VKLSAWLVNQAAVSQPWENCCSGLKILTGEKFIIARPSCHHSLNGSFVPIAASCRWWRRQRVDELLDIVGLDIDMGDRYAHEFSGGQRQRVGIARALALNPEFVVADEPVSALDVSIQAQIINLLLDLREQFNLTMLFISHDLSVVKLLSDRILVMYLGKILEEAPGDALYREPLHPYTRLLLRSIPLPDPDRKREKIVEVEREAGMAAMMEHQGCPFYARCPERQAPCRESMPELRDRGGRHKVACFLYR